MWLKNNTKYVNVKKNVCFKWMQFLKAIYHLGCMFWMCLAHLWNYLKRCTLKYYDTFIEGCENGTLWSNSRTARDKNNCVIIIKGLFCCIWTRMNLTTVLTLSLPRFISLSLNTLLLDWNGTATQFHPSNHLKASLSWSSGWKHRKMEKNQISFWIYIFLDSTDLNSLCRFPKNQHRKREKHFNLSF